MRNAEKWGKEDAKEDQKLEEKMKKTLFSKNKSSSQKVPTTSVALTA